MTPKRIKPYQGTIIYGLSDLELVNIPRQEGVVLVDRTPQNPRIALINGPKRDTQQPKIGHEMTRCRRKKITEKNKKKRGKNFGLGKMCE